MVKKKNNGFTLVEALVVLAIMSMALFIALPTLSNFTPRQKFEAALRQLTTDIAHQRMRAVARHETTSLIYVEAERAYSLEPNARKRQFPEEVKSAVFPDVEFNTRGFLTSGNYINIILTRTDDVSRAIEISPAGRIRVGN